MSFKWVNKQIYVFLAALYVIVIVVLVQIEKGDANANIKSIYDGLWYSVVTLTTVGYGDYYPVTSIGKIIGLIVIFSSAFSSWPTSAFTFQQSPAI